MSNLTATERALFDLFNYQQNQLIEHYQQARAKADFAIQKLNQQCCRIFYPDTFRQYSGQLLEAANQMDEIRRRYDSLERDIADIQSVAHDRAEALREAKEKIAEARAKADKSKGRKAKTTRQPG
ncbi:MAG: hypothetical protein C3F11_01620 [Methylocystaceae bacterium]|nr:MAG: hypothetical protein C3F11_01620 [Methylocystaceae bacterium]